MTPPSKFEPHSLKEVLAEIKEQKNLAPGFKQQKLEDAWKEITGPIVSQYTTEVRWRSNQIYVRLSSAPLRNELSAGIDQLQKNLQEQLPELGIKKIVLL